MALKQFLVGFSRTINLGNFESAKVEAQVIVEVSDEDNYEATVAAAQRELRSLLEDTWREQYKPRDKDSVVRR